MTKTTTERGAVAPHSTGTVERPWSASTHVGRLPSPMQVSTARRMYAWFDSGRVENGQVVKDACSLPHHEVSQNGVPGVANLPGVRNALARLSGSNIPTADHDTIRSHLRGHLNAARGATGFDGELVRVMPGDHELRQATTGTGDVLTGHFSVFDTWYEVNSIFEGRFLERTLPGAFEDTIRDDRDLIKVTFNHGRDVLGDQVLGPIETLEEDEVGPRYDVPLLRGIPELLVEGLRHKVYGSSFRFRVTGEEWDEEPGESDHNPQGLPERTVTKVRVFEFGPVTFPANPDATAGIRSATDEHYEAMRERNPSVFEEACRSAGFAEISTGRPATRSAGGGGTSGPEAAPDAKPNGKASPSKTTPPGPKRRDSKVETEEKKMSLPEREVRVDEIKERLAEIDREYEADQLPAEVQDEWDSLGEELEVQENAISDAKSRKAYLAEIAERTEGEGPAETRATANRNRFGGRGNGRGAGFNTAVNQAPIYDVAELRRLATSIDHLPELYREHAMRATAMARFPSRMVNREQAQANIERLLDEVDDEHGTIARRIIATGGPLYHRAFGKALTRLSTMGLSNDEQRALSVGTDTAGGFAVPFQLDPTILLTSDGVIDPLRQISRVEQVTGKEWQGVTSAGITVTRGAEGSQAGDNTPTLAQPTVRPIRVQGFVPFSRELEVTWSALASEMTRLLNDAKMTEEADSFANGDGTGTNPNGVVATLDAGSEVNEGGGNFSSTDLYAVEEATPPRFRARGRWLANKSTYNLVRQLAQADGGDLWVRLAAGQPSELIGYPAHEGSEVPSRATGARYLLFGDFSQFLIVDQIGMSVELIPHLFGANQRPTGQRGIYAIWNNNSLILADNAFRVLVGTT